MPWQSAKDICNCWEGKERIMRWIFLIYIGLIAVSAAAQPTEVFADRLTYVNEPIQVLSAPGDPSDRIFIACHDGKIWIFENGALHASPFLDLGPDGIDVVDYGIMSEQGLNGIAFDPDYQTNGYFYVVYNGYTPDGEGNLIDERIVCFERDNDNPDQASLATWYNVLTLEEPDRGHNGGQLHLGPDGHFYFSTGDGGSTGTGVPGGGSGGDDHGPIGNAQSLATLLGKMLRIDLHGMEPYTIPEDNPFVGDPDALDEIWAYGFRNPWRWSFDRATGNKFIGDVGEVDWEEISFEAADSEGGLNFGWRIKEAFMCYEPTEDCDPENITTEPVFAYPHSNGLCSVIGGVTYRGEQIPTLQGYFIFGDACGFEDIQFWAMSADDGNFTTAPITITVDGGFVPWDEGRFAFGEDNDGEIYVCTRLAIYKLAYDVDNPIAPTEVDFLLGPNPAKNVLNIQLPQGGEMNGIVIIDALGREVMNEPFETGVESKQLDVSQLASGTYVVKVWFNDLSTTLTQKLIIQKDE